MKKKNLRSVSGGSDNSCYASDGKVITKPSQLNVTLQDGFHVGGDLIAVQSAQEEDFAASCVTVNDRTTVTKTSNRLW